MTSRSPCWRTCSAPGSWRASPPARRGRPRARRARGRVEGPAALPRRDAPSEGQLALERRAELRRIAARGRARRHDRGARAGGDRRRSDDRLDPRRDVRVWRARRVARGASAALGDLGRCRARLRAVARRSTGSICGCAGPTLTRAKFLALLRGRAPRRSRFRAWPRRTRSISICASSRRAARPGSTPRPRSRGPERGGGPRESPRRVRRGSARSRSRSRRFARVRPSARAAVARRDRLGLARLAAIPAIVWWVAPHVYETPDAPLPVLPPSRRRARHRLAALRGDLRGDRARRLDRRRGRARARERRARGRPGDGGAPRERSRDRVDRSRCSSRSPRSRGGAIVRRWRIALRRRIMRRIASTSSVVVGSRWPRAQGRRPRDGAGRGALRPLRDARRPRLVVAREPTTATDEPRSRSTRRSA